MRANGVVVETLESFSSYSHTKRPSMGCRIIGIGTDIIECLRIAQMIERHGELFIRRVYTDHEIAYCSTKKAATQHYAGRWAAKEAVLKALGTGWVRGISWRDVEVRHKPGGAPAIALRGGAQEVFERTGITHMHVSISHCRTHATAYAVAEGDVDERP
jgi:holo-[acyl-carrier protein] synthase